MVTHDASAAAVSDRALFLADGLIVRDAPCDSASDIMAILAELSAQ
jgi:ABC-type lipoprotein export system ATPase subunit